MIFTYALYIITIICLLFSYAKNKTKTKMALKKAWKAFENILPQLLSVLLIIGMMLSVLNEKTISQLIGEESGALGMVIAAVIGSVTLIPGFVAFPLAASLLEAGAGFAQIAMFVSTLMMVGVVTLPLESSFFSKKLALKRNLLALLFSVIVSLIMGGLLG